MFLNNPAADENTPTTKEHGYAGSFHVYGYGLWPGDIGNQPSKREGPPEAVRAPIEKVVITTDALRAAAAKGPEIVVTVVPVYPRQPTKISRRGAQGAQVIIN